MDLLHVQWFSQNGVGNAFDWLKPVSWTGSSMETLPLATGIRVQHLPNDKRDSMNRKA